MHLPCAQHRRYSLFLPVILHAVEPDGGGGGSGRIDRGIKITAVSIKILNRNRHLLWFSLLTGLVLAFMVITQYVLHLLSTYPYYAIDFLRWVLLTFAINVASVFCFTVLLAGLLLSLSPGDSGRSASFREGPLRVKGYLKPLAVWSVIMAFVGTVIYVPLSNFGFSPFTLYPVLDQFPFNFILFPEVYSTAP